MEDHAGVGRVRGCGVVVEHGSLAARREHGCDEMGSGIHIAVGSCVCVCVGGFERVLSNIYTDEKNSLLSRKAQVRIKHTHTFIFGKVESEMSL